MALTVEDQGLHDMSFLWENHSWGPSNSDNSGESKENINPLNRKEERDEALMNKKRNRDQTKITSGEGKDEKCREPDHEMHIWTERERRKKMKNMFASLHALLPHLPSKADKSTVVDEAVNYIKNLQQTLEKLEKQKQERLQYVSTFGCESSMFVTYQGSSNNFSNAMMGTSNELLVPVQQPVAFDKTWASSNMVLNICGDEAQFTICAAHKPGLMTTIAFVLGKYKIEVVSAIISSIGNGNACMIQAHGKRASHQFLDANLVEEIYKQVAGEIMLWIA
ncbi:Transcription factor bHLH95 [Spatholobus suberectus]|nr:Transcription factor bHLH95 [Spatholobus suberectus]